tara:strand:- start:9796 stop:10107 length:312 start_codon:yes stop_codon:yes gene_type:complete
MPDNNICCTQNFSVGDICRCGMYNADRSQFTVTAGKGNCLIVRTNSLGIEDSTVMDCRDAQDNIIEKIALFGEEGNDCCQKKISDNDWLAANGVHYNAAGVKQ